MPETIPIKPADLLIDDQNPRISQPGVGQHKTLQAIAHRQRRKLQMLASDIAANGLNPADLLIVMPTTDDSKRYVVLEGNRRLVALRVLESPEVIADAVPQTVLSEIRKLSRAYQTNPIKSIQCVVMKDRDEARHWIQLRHTGENAGAGIVKWGAVESSRFRARGGAPEVHSQAISFLERRGDLTLDDLGEVPTTSFRRLLGTPEVRAKLGIDVQDGTLRLLADADLIAKALLYVVNDLASGNIKVKDIYTKDQRIKYAKTLPANIVVTATAKGHGVPASGVTGVGTPKGGMGTRATKPRDKLIPRDCALNIGNQRVREIAIELTKLSLTKFTNAVSVLFRVFLELSVDSYIEAKSLSGVTTDSPFNQKLEFVANDLVARQKLTRQEAKPARKAAQKNSLAIPSSRLLHEYVHNRHMFPGPADLRAQWNSLQPFILATWMP